MEEVRREKLKINGGEIPIQLIVDDGDEGTFYMILVDGVEWIDTPNRTHAIVLFEMMKDHITDYMNYSKI